MLFVPDVFLIQNQSYPIASSPTGSECPPHKEDGHHQFDNNPICKEDIKEMLKCIKSCYKETERLMNVPSTGKFGEGGGGLYQTPKPSHIVNLIMKIYPHVCSVLDDFPHLTREASVTMMDAGAGMHIPGVLFAMYGGYHSIGLEIDETRCALAADFLHSVVKKNTKANVALFNRDVVEPSNWSKVVVFFFWDRVGVTSDILSFYHSTKI